MLMRYLAVQWAPQPTPSDTLAQVRKEIELSGHWVAQARTKGLSIWTSSADQQSITPLGRFGFILGEIYRTSDGARWPPSPDAADASGELLERICSEAFGRYVALTGGDEPAAFRDPSGGVDCFVWRLGSLTLVSNAFSDIPPALWPPRLALDWEVIAHCVASASVATTELALQDMWDVAPGTTRSLTDLSQSRALWTPAMFAGRQCQAAEGTICEDLIGRVDLAVGALASQRERLVVEVSGGLDSAIVAASIARLGLKDRVVSWLNYFADRPEGDERPYARGLAQRLNAPLSAAHLPVRALCEADFAEVATGARPPVNALVPVRDEDTASRMAELEASALVSGQGGDAIFYQMPTALILNDELQRRGPSALRSPLALALARRLRRSIWSVGAEACRGNGRPVGPKPGSVTTLPRDAAREDHPWIGQAAKLPPAKRLQIIGLANAHVATGDCRIARAGDLLYPLTAQPVAEFCLSLPAALLTAGGQERGLARKAFANHLPKAILNRRKKGELTAFHAQTVAASLDFLRPYLLEGCLCEAGVLNRHNLEAILHRDQLLWRGEGSEILLAAAIESWVRHWQRYVPDASGAGRRQLWGAGSR